MIEFFTSCALVSYFKGCFLLRDNYKNCLSVINLFILFDVCLFRLNCLQELFGRENQVL